MTMRQFSTPEEIQSTGARGILAHWKTEVKRGVVLSVQRSYVPQQSLDWADQRIPPAVGVEMLHGDLKVSSDVFRWMVIIVTCIFIQGVVGFWVTKGIAVLGEWYINSYWSVLSTTNWLK